MEQLLTLYSEVQSTDVRWLWYPFIAIGKITLLQGDPGDGKSTLMMNLIAELSTGGKTPDGCKIGAPQKVIYQCSEDGVSDTIKDGMMLRKMQLSFRLKKMNKVPSRLKSVQLDITSIWSYNTSKWT